ncbi:STAS domain-containing protein [Paenisporosarcina quisquiliarum]|uniref:STAS domain-containing protein n=1 Tax=Paenisporosarcina quisquiliarum TaxID=365346 RepID=A0A9X3LF99_9BACL|nr:RsbT co-antagonist protein RsbRA [Paenisporosarcina quisquiliarum]MCZ8536697.1 STAS domain-containing protein [Paenisporosarcina quisquiliarum]
MNKHMATFIQDNLDEILVRWQEMMKDDSDEKFFQIMSQDVINKTSREFAELMISNLFEGENNYENRLNEFTSKVVRFGWSISFVMKAINHFAQVVYDMLEQNKTITEQNMKEYVMVFAEWINPMRDGIVETYAKTWERTVQLQKIALQELSASLIPVFDKISVMPLVGTIDTERAKLIMENLLDGVVKHRAEVVLLDITGVPVVDTMVAHHIIQAADAVRLVGAKCMLVGIRPEIAQTIVTLGINLKDFTTTSTLQRGVEQALAWTNRKIVEVEED